MYKCVHLSIILRCSKTFHQSTLEEPFVFQMLLIYTFMLLSVNKWALTYKLYLLNDLAFKQVCQSEHEDKPGAAKGQVTTCAPFVMTGSVRSWRRLSPLFVHFYANSMLLFNVVLETSPALCIACQRQLLAMPSLLNYWKWGPYNVPLQGLLNTAALLHNLHTSQRPKVKFTYIYSQILRVLQSWDAKSSYDKSFTGTCIGQCQIIAVLFPCTPSVLLYKHTFSPSSLSENYQL